MHGLLKETTTTTTTTTCHKLPRKPVLRLTTHMMDMILQKSSVLSRIHVPSFRTAPPPKTEPQTHHHLPIFRSSPRGPRGAPSPRSPPAASPRAATPPLMSREGRCNESGAVPINSAVFPMWCVYSDPLPMTSHDTPWDCHICRSVGVVLGVNVGIYGSPISRVWVRGLKESVE